MAEELREGPKAGDRLLFIDGQPAPDADRGEEGDTWDHSKTYAMLEAAGLRHKVMRTTHYVPTLTAHYFPPH